ncbi:hypothetical protein D3C71_2109380 [compost metagenome]
MQERGSYPLPGNRLMQLMEPHYDLIVSNGYGVEHQPLALGIIERLTGKSARSPPPAG